MNAFAEKVSREEEWRAQVLHADRLECGRGWLLASFSKPLAQLRCHVPLLGSCHFLFRYSIDRFYLVKDADASWRDLEFEIRNDIICMVRGLFVSIAWRCFPYRLERETTSIRRYQTFENTNRIVL